MDSWLKLSATEDGDVDAGHLLFSKKEAPPYEG